MPDLTRRGALAAAGTVGASLLGLPGASAETPETDLSTSTPTGGVRDGLVGTWMAAHHPAVPDDFSSDGFENETIRQVVHTSVDGDGLRLRLANTFGDQPLVLESGTVGYRTKGAAADPDSLTDVTFSGNSRVRIPPGARAYSDPVPLSVRRDQDLVVSFYAPSETGPMTWHNFGKDTAYTAFGDETGTASGGFRTLNEAYYFLDGVDVVNPDVDGAIVTLGDSITDGAGSTVGEYTTYPDQLSRRLNHFSLAARVMGRDSVEKKAVLNAGINGNRLLTNESPESDMAAFGPSALERLERDVLAQTGVTDLVLLVGINDLLHATFGFTPEVTVTADRLIDGYEQIVARCHAADVRVTGATITPAGDNLGDDDEQTRTSVNEFIRDGGVFDDVVDFAAALEDPDEPGHLRPEYDSGDGLHPSDEGYWAMAWALDHRSLINW